MTESRLFAQLEALKGLIGAQVMLPAAQLLKTHCVEIVAVDTGHLRDSGVADELAPSENGAFVSFGGGEYEVSYAKFVEFGNSNPNYPIQPYMRPSVDNYQGEYSRVTALEVNKQMRDLVR